MRTKQQKAKEKHIMDHVEGRIMLQKWMAVDKKQF